jgi:hypothetical protein
MHKKTKIDLTSEHEIPNFNKDFFFSIMLKLEFTDVLNMTYTCKSLYNLLWGEDVYIYLKIRLLILYKDYVSRCLLEEIWH